MKYLIYILFSFPFVATSHPVIYKGGWVYQSTFMPKMNELKVSYSATSNYSLEVNSTYLQNISGYQDYTLGANFLAKRWLQDDSQGNIYLGAHGGYYYNDNTDGLAGHLFVMADWESRVHYTMFRAKTFLYNNQESYEYVARYGFAPFVAGMDALQSWLIIQAQYLEENNRAVLLTPMLRFFYRNVLWEMGSSTRGQYFLTLMVHY